MDIYKLMWLVAVCMVWQLVVGTTVFRGTRNFEPSHGICQLPRNFYVFAEFCGIGYWPVIRGQIRHILVVFRWIYCMYMWFSPWNIWLPMGP